MNKPSYMLNEMRKIIVNKISPSSVDSLIAHEHNSVGDCSPQEARLGPWYRHCRVGAVKIVYRPNIEPTFSVL